MGRYYGPSFLKDPMMAFWDTKNWLYADDWDEQKLSWFRRLYGFDMFRGEFDSLLDARADQEYFNRYGMTYSDIHDPRKLAGTSSAANVYSTAYRFVSKNVHRLYH